MTPWRPRSKSGRYKVLLALVILAGAALLAWVAVSLTKAASIGKDALEQANRIIALGPRPCGSEAHQKAQAAIVEKLTSSGMAVDQDHFTAKTPVGSVPMNNIIGRIPGRGGISQRTIILATHYDTKLVRDFRFVGANDGGSGTGLLLALAPLLVKQNYRHNIWLVFLDGEEAFREWSATDSLYGSRHMAGELKARGIAPQIGAFILLDMVGDADLGILQDSNSTPWLRDLVWKAAARLGYSKHFLSTGTAMEDDHMPFLQAGIPSVDVIDFDYGPGNSYWHTVHDTADKLSAQSLQIVGDVVLETLSELDGQ
ncbi:MAG: M28 family peptidase [Acidobacteria bacterium]|nr:M28 family peptidase [Acidobacteriota bacterium]